MLALPYFGFFRILTFKEDVPPTLVTFFKIDCFDEEPNVESKTIVGITQKYDMYTKVHMAFMH